MRNHPDLPADAPQWLRDADVEQPVWRDGVWHGGVWHGGVWHGGVWGDGVWRSGEWHCGEWRSGEWHDGVWRGGVWHGGVWGDGVWRGGVWRDGVWHDGVWHGGVWRSGEWHGGVWRSGEWHDGVWHGGEWRDESTPNRLMYMAASLGIVFDERGYARAYRTTQANGRGRYTEGFVQPDGAYYEADAEPAGSGTCVKGIHVTSAARAWAYFGIDKTCQLWAVDFVRADLLDCDGEKARIRGGTFMRIATPWMPK